MTKKTIGHRDPLEIANYFLKKGVVCTPMKVVKLVYIAHGWFMAFYGKKNLLTPLINEDAQAWAHGPVIPSVFHAFKGFNYSAINQTLLGVPEGESLSKKEKEHLDSIIEYYGDFDAWKLSDMTHQAGTPWSRIYDQTRFKVIPNEMIYDYYNKRRISHLKEIEKEEGKNG